MIVELGQTVTPAFGCRVISGFSWSTEPFNQVIGPLFSSKSTLRHAKMYDCIVLAVPAGVNRAPEVELNQIWPSQVQRAWLPPTPDASSEGADSLRRPDGPNTKAEELM